MPDLKKAAVAQQATCGHHGIDVRRLLGIFILLAGATLFAAGAPQAAVAQVVGGFQGEFNLIPQDGIQLDAFHSTSGNRALLGAFFKFHPEVPTYATVTKDFATNQVRDFITGDLITKLDQYYPLSELHGTTGVVTHKLSLDTVTIPNPKPDKDPIDIEKIHDSVKVSITPGPTQPPLEVNVHGLLDDPISYSNTSPDAQFPFGAGGLQIPFSLQKETAFPSVFAQNPGDYGAIAADTSMDIRFRVVAGVVTDPATFWSDSLPGAIDLATLKITSDSLYNVTATLTIGAGNSDFSVSSSDPAAAEAAIEAAFAGNHGQLLADLNDIFSVAFTPLGGVSEYTVGYQRNLGVAAWEVAVPEPGAETLLVLGVAMLFGWRKVRTAD